MSVANNGSPIQIDISGLLKIANQMKNSICKIFENNKLSVLVTNNHIIDDEYIKRNKNIHITMNDDTIEKDIILDESKTIYSSKDYNLTIIEINEKDGLENNFLDIDNELLNNNSNNSDDKFKGKSIYIIQYQKGIKSYVSNGVLEEIDDYHIKHSCSDISAGSPIMSLDNYSVIGIHCGTGTLNYNKGIFLKKPFLDYIKKLKPEKNEPKKNIENYILIVVEVERNDIGKLIYFLNGRSILYGVNRQNKPYQEKEDIDIFENIIGDDIEIYINEQKQSNFSRIYTPKEVGIDFIKLIFNKELTNCSNMFRDCSHIIRIDLSHFNSKNVTDMSLMFYRCEKLKSIKLDNFDTRNVIDMEKMFFGCRSLEEIDLFSFNTENVRKIKYFFSDCDNLEIIKNFYFNTKNISCMEYMFFRCLRLCNIDLSFFNTENVVCMFAMFADCKSLSSIDLSYFDTTKLNTFKGILGYCNKLERIELREETYKKIKNEIDELKKSNRNVEIVFNSKKNELYN